MLRLRDRLRPRGDEGFSLLEAVIALAISGVIFTALSAATLSSLKAVLVGRTVQQSADVAQQAMEELRSLGYDAATMKDADIAVNDPLGMTADSYYDPIKDTAASEGQANAEAIAHDPAGAVSPHVTTVTPSASSSYTVRRYVTIPEDSTEANGTEYKRLTVVVTWTVRGETRTRIQSALITAKRSGLPLPDYKFTSVGLNYACVNPGNAGSLGFSIANNGARDSWTISATGGSQSWAYFLDDGSGAYEPGTDTTPLPGSVVGPIETTESKVFWAVTDTQPSTPAGSTAVTFKATSVAQPTYSTSLVDTFQVTAAGQPCAGAPVTTSPTPTPTGTSSPSPTPTVSSTPPPTPTTCAQGTVPTASGKNGATITNYYMPNGSTNTGNTVAASLLTLRKTPAPTGTTLWNYSTDLSSGTAGRRVALTGSSVATTAQWNYQFGPSTELAGTGTVSLWGAPASGVASSNLGFTVTVQKVTGTGTVSTIGTATYPAAAWNCAGFKKFGVSFNFGQNPNTTKFNALESIAVQVKSLGGDALIAYDTSTFAAAVVLPVRNGG